MMFQIKNIIIYGKNKKKRTLELKTNSVNVITGQSKTGKSALIHIVDYCLGSKKCNIPAGMIRKNVSWFAIKIKTSSGDLFIARKNPEAGKATSQDIYFNIGTDIAIPEFESLVKNTNLDTIKSILSYSLGIGDYPNLSNNHKIQKTGKADIRKALFYCFQTQSEVDNQNYLFHRQGDPFVTQTIKDFLPYFLGIITNDYAHKKVKLRDLKRKLNALQGKINENQKIYGHNFEQAYALINEAKAVGLISQDLPQPDTWEKISLLLQGALSYNFENEVADLTHLNKLYNERQALKTKYRIASEKLEFFSEIKEASSKYDSELKQQKARLEPIGLFSSDVEGNTCPLCSSALHEEIPSVEAIKGCLVSTRNQLESLYNETPHIDKLIQKAKIECENKKRGLLELNKSISSLENTNEQISLFRDQNAEVALIKGRLSLYLEHMPEGEIDLNSDIFEIDGLNQQIQELEAELDDDTLTDRTNSALSFISSKITKLARRLGLEHSDSPMRLDLNKLTVIADTVDEPILMQNMGSGETWIGLHLVTHLSLHQWFVNKSSPVPQFLFFDQPSQAYFPPDYFAETGMIEADKENLDRMALIEMLRLVVSETENFQVVITDHANIEEDWFQKLISENWWDGNKKLVPVDWL